MRCLQNSNKARLVWLGKVALSLLLLTAASGCYETIPVNAVQELTIYKDGSFQVDYVGRFTDLRRFIEAAESERSRTNKKIFTANRAKIAEERHTYMRQIGSIKGVREFRYLGNDLYKFSYHATGNLRHSEIPELVDASIGNSQKIASFIQLRSGGDGFRFVTPDDANNNSRDEWQLLSNDNGAMAAELRRLFKRLKGTLKIRTDAYVESHNAQQVRKMRDGMIEYKWHITRDNVFDVHFAFSLEAPDTASPDASHYPPGTDCIKTFGEQCKCSFVLVPSSPDESMAYRAYRIETHSGKIVEGCADAEGNTEVILENLTGSCSIVVLTQELSAARCQHKE